MATRKRPSRKQVINKRYPAIKAAASKLKKAELVDLVVQLAKNYPEVCSDLESELEIVKPTDLLIIEIESAIANATFFDEDYRSGGFDYDYGAFKTIERGFKELIKQGYLDQVKELAHSLMKSGSYQVECSDGSMMLDDIETCLKPVIRAIAKGDKEEAKQWAKKMSEADRAEFICRKELSRLM